MAVTALKQRSGSAPRTASPRAPMPADPVRQFSFTDFQVANPTTPPPGDKLDGEFDRADNAISAVIDWASTSLNTDGSIRDAIIGENNLVPGLFDDLSTGVIADVQPLVDDAQAFADAAAASALTAETAAETATNQATASGGSAAAAGVSAMAAANLAFQALDSQNSATSSASAASNSANTAGGAEAICVDYGVLTQAWAEHMPDPIPPNILATMGVTGNHWSARWWAAEAASAFGSFATLYLGAWPSPPTTTATGDPIPIGAIYYNTTLEQVFVWNGQEWVPFYAPTKSLTLSLIYRTTAGQTTINMTVPDLVGNTWAIAAGDPEPLEVYSNGVRLSQTQGSFTGDWSLNPTTSTITLIHAPVTGTLVQIDILAPASELPPARVTTQQLLDFDVDPTSGTAGQIDGTRTTFPLALVVPPHTSITVARAVDLLVFLDGVTQKPGNDYNVTGTNITFGEAPTPGGSAWALWFAPDLSSGLGRSEQLAQQSIHSPGEPNHACICPVGTILTSLLDIEQFQDEVGLDTTWIPCDGRSIAGTRLAEILNSDSLPDQQGRPSMFMYYVRVD